MSVIFSCTNLQTTWMYIYINVFVSLCDYWFPTLQHLFEIIEINLCLEIQISCHSFAIIWMNFLIWTYYLVSMKEGLWVMPYNIKLVLHPKIGLVWAKNLWNFRMFSCNRVEILYEYTLNKTILYTNKGPDRTSWQTVLIFTKNCNITYLLLTCN